MTDLIAKLDALYEKKVNAASTLEFHDADLDFRTALYQAWPQFREMATDVERLDWLDSHPDADVRIAGYGSPRFHGKTLRESIDAMQGGDK